MKYLNKNKQKVEKSKPNKSIEYRSVAEHLIKSPREHVNIGETLTVDLTDDNQTDRDDEGVNEGDELYENTNLIVN